MWTMTTTQDVRDARNAARLAIMRAMRALAREAMAAGLTDTGDVVEDVAAWELYDREAGR